MLQNLLTFAEKTREIEPLEACLYALLGFLIVFIGIAFLIFIVWLVGKVMQKSSGFSNRKEESPIQEIKSIESTEGIDEETVAVITAAIMAYYQETNPKCEFTVKRIKKL